MTRFQAMVQAQEAPDRYNKEKLLQNFSQLSEEEINKLCLEYQNLKHWHGVMSGTGHQLSNDKELIREHPDKFSGMNQNFLIPTFFEIGSEEDIEKGNWIPYKGDD